MNSLLGRGHRVFGTAQEHLRTRSASSFRPSQIERSYSKSYSRQPSQRGASRRHRQTLLSFCHPAPAAGQRERKSVESCLPEASDRRRATQIATPLSTSTPFLLLDRKTGS